MLRGSTASPTRSSMLGAPDADERRDRRVTDDELVRDVQRLFATGLTPTEVAAVWTDLGLTREDATDLALLPTSTLTVLGNLEGAPYSARSAANVAVLDRRIASAKQFLDDLDRPDRIYSAEARKDAEDLSALESIKAALNPGGPKAPRTLTVLSADHRLWLRSPSGIWTKRPTSPGRCRGWGQARAA